VASRGPFLGSKRAIRAQRLEEKKVRGFQKRLNRLAELATQITDEQHFQSLLAQIEDPQVRTETEKFLTPLLTFERSSFVKPEPAPFGGLIVEG
jgi:hypothetical protein